ncbi:phosphotransferase system HPr-like phosphotransfer protein [Pedobacter sp. UYP30]|uniref:hypothetical protein n=1 Tax=Pedobacter sp. UYP30 TaxID=1756400 RepID=UPI0033955E4B
MKKLLFVLSIALTACGSESKKANGNDTIDLQNVDTIKKDTIKVAPVKEKSDEEKAEERLDRIMKNRKSVK